jgi:Tat protein translocase TatB subunit
MFNIGGGEFLVILLVALIVLGPNRLPEAARQAGKVMGELRKISSGFQNELRTAIADADKESAAPAPAASAAVDPEVANAIAEATAAAETVHAETPEPPAAAHDDQAAAS